MKTLTLCGGRICVYVLVLYIMIIVIRMVSKIIRVVVRFPPVGCLMPATNKVSGVKSNLGSNGSIHNTAYLGK